MSKQRIHLVHGWTYNIDNWDKFLEELSRQGFEPIVHKVPGLTEKSEEVWDVEKYVEWIRSEVELEISPIMLGHSNGGRILLAYSNIYPKHLSHLVLIGSAGMPDKRSSNKIKKIIFGNLAKVIGPLIPEGQTKKNIYRLIRANDYGSASPNMRETMKNMLAYDEKLDFKSIKTPTTLIWGEHDSYTPVEQGLELRSELGNVVSWNLIKNAGHSPQINHSKDVVDIIAKDVKEKD